MIIYRGVVASATCHCIFELTPHPPPPPLPPPSPPIFTQSEIALNYIIIHMITCTMQWQNLSHAIYINTMCTCSIETHLTYDIKFLAHCYATCAHLID